MTNSLQKGKRGERGFRDKLREFGFDAERGAQRSGSPDSPDIKCELPFHFEVKFRERLQLRDAYDQSASQAGHKIPVVAHRSNREPWMITISADDFLRLVQHSDLI